MSEKSERLLEALSEIDDAKIDRAAPVEKTYFHWKRWSALAAVLVLVVAGGVVLPRLLVNNAPGSGAGGSGHENGSTVFMSYAGPMLPLSLREEEPELSASRQITLDFAPWIPEWQSDELRPEGGYWKSSTDIQVTDAYTLTNLSGEEKTVSVLYPFVSTLQEVNQDAPVLRADGRELEAVLHAGKYPGGFRSADDNEPQNVNSGGGQNPEEEGDGVALDLSGLDSWEHYQALLSGGGYQAAALEAWPDFSDVSVIVYKFTDYWGPEPDDEAGIPNPTIRAGFDLDYDKTTVLSYGFHGARFDPEAGTMIQEFSIPQPHSLGYGDPYYLFVIGDDIQNLTTGGYVTGGTDADTKTLPECRVDVERYETDLERALREMAELMYGGRDWADAEGNVQCPDFEMYFGLLKEYLVSAGPLSEDSERHHDTGWLEMMDFDVAKRVFYLEAEVTIPAEGSVALRAEMRREASFDFYCAHTENQGIRGYDLAAKLGSSLNITSQTAVLEDRGQIEIVRQNFGFDLEKGINEVTLDPEVEHYYLEVRGR